MNQEEFWKIRSMRYDCLNWVNEPEYIQQMISSADFNKNDSVLDVGTGTGVIAHAVSPLVREVVGLDISQDMLKHSNWKNNMYFIKRNINDPIFCNNVFDKVTARMVFHHITKNTKGAMDECYRVLKNDGKMILSEGIPPSPDVKKDYEDIFKLKEERLTFLEEDLIDLMKNAGFKNIIVKQYVMRGFSVKNWLENSGLAKEKQDRIFEMHVTGSNNLRNAYNMKIINGDCLIDTKNVIVVGEK